MTGPLVEKTPYELLKGRKPNISHLRAFGCKCFVHNNGKDSLGKFDSRSDGGVFLGYSSHSKAYKIEAALEEGTSDGTGPSTQGNLTGGIEQRENNSQTSREPVHESVPQQQSIERTSRGNQLNLCAFDAFLSLIEPKNVAEALQDVDWVNIMQDELNQFERSQVWHLVPRPLDRLVIGTKWVSETNLLKMELLQGTR
ncbi:uncharacterized protein [Nicotiana tomentosiformis]|uniref:uncharacterized protein n=1 Tax=Nicotiana tomentosiformis TaxID=4098 RepID=UPI00388C5CA6